ncbi:MAG: hypothetical protein IIU72_03055 [Muribaculaceae bacterium]|nr:hypothetical protein [Muribaculaceae bacterium]
MKKIRLITTLLAIILTITAFGKDNDITMVSYEQSWLDYEGTIALKNNTNTKIENIVFQITYFDMSGNELDYEEFTENIEINPKKTKKINIPAYERGRSYHYYKTPDGERRTKFKIQFKLIDYNVESSAFSTRGIELYEHDKQNPLIYIICAIAIMLFVLGITIGSYVLVALMAQKRNRNAALWVLLSIVASPLLVIIILLCIGNDDKDE